MNIGIHSETGHLQKVIVHTPGGEVSLVNPELKDELLFDDIIFEGDAREEHRDMLKMLKAAMPQDGEILQVTDLVCETFKNTEAREYFIELLIREVPEDNFHLIENALSGLSPEKLLKFVVEGFIDHGKTFKVHPSPNLLFTRDLAAVVGTNIILSRAAKRARIRESLLMDMLIEFHPVFEPVRDNIIRITGNQSIEGGDVLVASKELVIIGMSERTSFSGLMNVAGKLLDKNVECILAVDIPKQRSSMHLDTIFTFSDENECVVFPPAIEEQENNVVALTSKGDGIRAEPMKSLKFALEEITGNKFTFIRCGGADRTNQYREQWTDGANVFALAPGVIAGYERNTNTFNELVEHGYRYMDQFEFIEEISEKGFDPEREDKIAISFRGHELCRGRGGARCMTLPLTRKNNS
ncbi:MAG: arginine deiminase family protein [Balneolaceae bacterium]